MSQIKYLDEQHELDIHEQAITVLSTCACTRQWGIGVEADALGIDMDAEQLAIAAWRAADTGEPLPSFGSGDWDESWRIYFDRCAEAEAMLLTGWTP